MTEPSQSLLHRDSENKEQRRASQPSESSTGESSVIKNEEYADYAELSYQSGIWIEDEHSASQVNEDVQSLFDRKHLGLAVNYACSGFFNGLLPAMIYPFFKLFLNMHSYQVAAATSFISLPAAYKTLFGILTDNYPVLGYRRKSYMIIGWLIAFVAWMCLSFGPREEAYYEPGEIRRTSVSADRVVQNPHAPESGTWYLVLIMVSFLGVGITDVACDGITVELAQQEPIEQRGSIQATTFVLRFSGKLVGTVLSVVCFNGDEYGGTFEWSVPYRKVFFGCGVLTLMGAISTAILLVEKRDDSDAEAHPFRQMWRIVQQRAVWQMMTVLFVNAFTSNFGFAGQHAIQEYWARVVPLSNSVGRCVAVFLSVATFAVVKAHCLNTSWRTLIVCAALLHASVNLSVNSLTALNVIRKQWFFLSGPVLSAISDSVRFVIGGFVAVEVAEHHFESATMSLLMTVYNMATLLATSSFNFVDSFFDVSDANISHDTPHVRHEVVLCLAISAIVELLGLVALPFHPRQKRDAQDLKRNGGSSRAAGMIALLLVVLVTIWATFISLLSIGSSTACLRLAGGRGC